MSSVARRVSRGVPPTRYELCRYWRSHCASATLRASASASDPRWRSSKLAPHPLHKRILAPQSLTGIPFASASRKRSLANSDSLSQAPRRSPVLQRRSAQLFVSLVCPSFFTGCASDCLIDQPSSRLIAHAEVSGAHAFASLMPAHAELLPAARSFLLQDQSIDRSIDRAGGRLYL